MVVTIDKAGRVVVPKALRDQLIRKEGVLIHHGTTRTPLDLADFIRAERDARQARVSR